MIVICGWCKRFIEEKEPLEVLDVTHGICKKCGAKQLEEIEELRKSLEKPTQRMEG